MRPRLIPGSAARTPGPLYGVWKLWPRGAAADEHFCLDSFPAACFLLPRSRSTDTQQRDEDINSPMSRGITQKSHRPRQESLSRSPSSSPHRRRRAPSTASRFPFPDARKKGSIDADRRQRQGEGGGAGVGTEDLIKDPIKNGQLTWGSVFGC